MSNLKKLLPSSSKNFKLFVNKSFPLEKALRSSHHLKLSKTNKIFFPLVRMKSDQASHKGEINSNNKILLKIKKDKIDMKNEENTKTVVKKKKKNGDDEGVNIVIHTGEMKDAQQIFELAWNNLVKKVGDENMTFPKEILFLAGAPGAGKGEMVDYIKKLRGISSETIQMSKILKSPEAEDVKAKGGLVASRHVVQILLQKLLDKQFSSGVVVDGFPRTKVQGECIKKLYDKMMDYKSKYSKTIYNAKFNRPHFQITVLFIEEEISIQRQLLRGRKAIAHNRRVAETGYGQVEPLRLTDTDEQLARRRYREFKEHVYESLRSIKSFFNFHFILADAEPEIVKSRILKELEYQSKTELQEETYEKVRRLPLAAEVVRGARLKLISRLEDYHRNHSVLFDEVIAAIQNEFVTIIKNHAIFGRVVIRTENELFAKKYALRMALDLFAERGFNVFLDVQKQETPVKIENGKVVSKKKRVYKFNIKFPKAALRLASETRFMI